ncbi:MAG: helix-turn-helix transcriptional regulator [Chloroflexi bacterium]|nr:helix-turn-helix transcriptional regulator [Chloroflexota bacterium]
MHDLPGAALDVRDSRAGRSNGLVDAPDPDRVPVDPDPEGPSPEVRPAESYGGAPYSAGGSGSFFRACILLLVSERPAHGYDLLERITRFGFDSGDSGWLYRTLRIFERDLILASTWATSPSGPPRRVYELTPAGRRLLDSWVISVRASSRSIEGFLDQYDQAGGPALAHTAGMTDDRT